MVTLRIRVSQIKRYCGAPLIILFQAFLLLSAIFLIQGNSTLANNVAVYAYYSLVIGVALQLISLLMNGKES